MKNFKDRLCGMNCHYRFYSFERFFQEMNRLGIKNVEIWTGPMHFYVDYNKSQSVEQLKEYAKKYDVKIIGICPEQTNPKPNNVAKMYMHIIVEWWISQKKSMPNIY
jgi:protein FrlC